MNPFGVLCISNQMPYILVTARHAPLYHAYHPVQGGESSLVVFFSNSRSSVYSGGISFLFSGQVSVGSGMSANCSAVG